MFLVWIAAAAALAAAEPATQVKELDGRAFRVRLVFEDRFDDLSHWLAETDGTVEAVGNELVWKCPDKKAGTIWCRERFAGPTIVEHDVVTVSGADNVNFIFYADRPEGLLETTAERSGKYSEYHAFANYIITYLTNFEPRWRIRFRRNPGFRLLSEASCDRPVTQGVKQRVAYVFERDGTMSLYADGRLLHSFRDPETPYQSGFHGFRTWNSVLRYSNFKVFAIVED
jgi:hypothetical protein